MKKLASYLANFTAPSAGFSQGEIKNDPGDGTGSGAVEQTVNDLFYSIVAFAKKYGPSGDISDTDESETASDNLDNIEKAIGIQNESVSLWLNGTTYAQDAHVMYLGLQFVSMENSNTGNDPIDNPDKWLPCFERNEALIKYQKADNITGGFEPLHDFRDAAYRQLFEWGIYNYGGDSVSGAGRNFQATGVHLDGTVITGDTTLENLFDVGGGDEYPLLDIIAPDVVGTRTLIDSRGRVPRVVDAIAGDTEIVGDVQEDQFQGHWHEEYGQAQVGTIASGSLHRQTNSSVVWSATITDSAGETGVREAITDTVNGTPLTGSETRVKNFVVGVTSILVFQEI